MVLRKIAELWDQYADTYLALSKNLYQAKTHLQSFDLTPEEAAAMSVMSKLLIKN